MDIPQTLPMKKSGTHSFNLPSISKTQSKIPSYRTTRAATTRHHSVFIDKIKDLTKDVRYEEMETTKITEQQKQLKGMLREFNQETYQILSRYIDRPVDLQSSKKPRATSTSMMEVKDKEISNSNDALEICKREMEALEKKCENLKYVTVEDFQRKIESIKSEIEQLRNSNKQIIKGNTLRGLSIKRGDSKASHEVSQIEQQKFILEKKKERLTEEMKFVSEEQEKLKESHNKADQEIKKMSDEYNKYEKEGKDMRDQKELVRVYEEKKKELESKKDKSERRTDNQPQEKEKEKGQSKALEFILQKQLQKDKTEKPTTKEPANKEPNQLTVSLNLNQKQTQSKKTKKQPVKPANSNKYQYQYLKLLKQLDETTRKLKTHDENIKQYYGKLESSRKEIQDYELKLQAAKKPTQEPNPTPSPVNDKNKEAGQEKKGEGEKKWSFF